MSRILQGKVVSLKMDKTAIVEVVRHAAHPLYKKLLRRSKRFKAATGAITVSVGDSVSIIETRRVSKDTYFRIMEEKK